MRFSLLYSLGLLFVLLVADLQSSANAKSDTSLVLKFEMREEVGPALWRKTDQAFRLAEKLGLTLSLST
jgi:membrane-bound ClpP family serine protease